MRCTASGDQDDQEHKGMVKTAHQLYETFSQRGTPALTMMENMLRRMLPMNFQVTKEAAEFATEAHIHHIHVHGGQPDQDMLLRSAGIRPGHKPGPRKVHRVEGSTDKRGCRKCAAPIQNAGRGCAKREVPTTS